MDSSCRNKVRKALKHGFTGEVRSATVQDLTQHSDFRRLYEQTMQRRGAPPLYFFEDRYYEELLKGVGSDLLLAEVRDTEGVVVSATLLMRHDERLHYHLAGSDPHGAGMGSNNLMLWTATQFAISQGLKLFHLGAGVGLRDSLFAFKRSFGGRELSYDVSGLIVDLEAYQEQVHVRAKEGEATPDALLESGYFPAYRADPTRQSQPRSST